MLVMGRIHVLNKHAGREFYTLWGNGNSTNKHKDTTLIEAHKSKYINRNIDIGNHMKIEIHNYTIFFFLC